MMHNVFIYVACATILFFVNHSLLAFDESRIKGTRPATLQYLDRYILNEDSIVDSFWAPGIDEGYVIQGLTVAEGFVLVSAYKSTDPYSGFGETRVYQMDSKSGRIAGYFELPSDVRHAGGLAYLGDGRLVVADTYRLYDIDLYQALLDQNSERAINGKLILRGELKGSGLGFDGEYLLTVRYDASDQQNAYFLSPDLFRSRNYQQINESHADRYITLPTHAQGAAFTEDGKLWVSFSNSSEGSIAQVDSQNGEVIDSYDLVAGLEDIGISKDGYVWAMSESGALRLSDWDTRFPVVFSLDVQKLAVESEFNFEDARD